MLTNQTTLKKIALQETESDVRMSALRRLIDTKGASQEILARVALDDADQQIRSAAIELLTDQATLARIAAGDKDEGNRIKALGLVAESNPVLKNRAFLDGASVYAGSKAEIAFARIKLAIQEPIIRNWFPGLVASASVSARSCTYREVGGNHQVVERFESSSIYLIQDGKSIASKTWEPYCPARVSNPDPFPSNTVRAEELLRKLLADPQFTQDDFVRLSSSFVPEVRMAAVEKLADQALLAKIAAEDKELRVREAASQRLRAVERGARNAN